MPIFEKVMVVYRVDCDFCHAKDQEFVNKTRFYIQNDLLAAGWKQKSYYKDTILTEEWYCPGCCNYVDPPKEGSD